MGISPSKRPVLRAPTQGKQQPSQIVKNTHKPLWKHQALTKKLCQTSNIVYDLSDPGCVSADTEFLTSTGWKRIDEYLPGDKVTQFYPDTKQIELVYPTEYIKLPCTEMLHIHALGISQKLSSEHRVLTYNKDKSWQIESAISFAARPSGKIFYTLDKNQNPIMVTGLWSKDITIIPNPEGFKYCFEVPTSFLILRHNGYIFATGNTGKTRAHLEAFAERRRNGGGCALVVAPKSLLETAWRADAWEFTKDMRCSVSYSHNRVYSFDVDADIYIVNTDGVKWLKNNLKPSFWKKFDTLIIDEISCFKHHTSQRSKAAKWLAKYFLYTAGLTGTPNPKSITEMWHQVGLLDGGARLGKSFYQFKTATQIAKQVGPRPEHIKWVDREGAEMSVFGLLQDITIRHLFEECMDIPPNVERHITFDLPSKVLKMYRKLEESTILELENATVVGINAAVLQNKMLQLASGAIYATDNEGEKTYKVLDTSRYELITALVDEGQHSVIFYNWLHQKEQLLIMAKKRGIECEYLDSKVNIKRKVEIINSFQAGNLQAIYLHPQTGAHGLTLTRGTRTIWSSPIYQPDFLKQGKHRIYRGGQTRRTETIMIEANNTVEKKVFTILNEDNTRMQDFLSIAHAARKEY